MKESIKIRDMRCLIRRRCEEAINRQDSYKGDVMRAYYEGIVCACDDLLHALTIAEMTGGNDNDD